jgi:hypothetical protein
VGAGRSKLRRKTEAAVAALLTEPTHAAAAARAGVAESTLHRWLRRPEFQAAYRAARERVVDEAVGQLQRAAGEAVATLRANLAGPRPADQIRAAVAILGQLARLDLDQRRVLSGREALLLAEALMAAVMRHVTDPAVVRAVADDFDRLTAGE